MTDRTAQIDRTDVLDRLTRLVAQVSDDAAELIGRDTRFDGLGRWGSLAAMRLLASVEREFRVKMDLRRYVALQTVGELADEIAGRP
jgi:acyl carrier protein